MASKETWGENEELRRKTYDDIRRINQAVAKEIDEQTEEYEMKKKEKE
jgi:hypothetical protein|tara:strand:+ start:474 stop:617 length:144 start_codon:yes stop_codon:yes gene_type:complete